MNRNKSRGSLTIEALLMSPVLVLILLVIVFTGRFTDAAFRVGRAADVSARVASQANASSMISRGVVAARADLTNGHSPCAKVDVVVDRGQIGRIATVTSTVTCTLNRSGLGILTLHQRVIRASSTEVIDYFSAR